MSLNFSFGPCEIVCNASIGNISEFAMDSLLCYLLTSYVHGCCYEITHTYSVYNDEVYIFYDFVH